MTKEKTIEERLRIKADMISLGERISWGSDSAIMREAADELEKRDRIAREDERERIIHSWNKAEQRLDGTAQGAVNCIEQFRATLTR